MKHADNNCDSVGGLLSVPPTTINGEYVRNLELFLAVIGHELRTQLAGLPQACSYLETEKGEQYLNAINIVSSNTLQVLDNILTTVKISSGKLSIKPITELFELTNWIRQLVIPFQLQCSMKRNSIQVFCDLSSEEIIVKTDKVKLGQVLANLLANAIKCSKPATSIDISIGVTANTALIEVKNIGTAIPSHKKEHLFKPFYQLDNGVAGTGLGLFLSSLYMEALGGTVAVDSQDSTTTFSIRFPISFTH